MLVAAIGYVSAQSLQFELDGNVYSDGETIVCTNFVVYEYLQEMQIRNLGSTNVGVIVEKEVVEGLDGVMDYYCWGQCFDPTISISDPVPVMAGEVTNVGALSFHAMFDDGVFGSILMKYYAYDERHPDERVSILVRFQNSGTGIAESQIELGHAYPNPASSFVRFDYKLSAADNASVSIYNLLGQEVMNQQLNECRGQFGFSVADLNEGIYFCNLFVNGVAVKTEKFIVKK